MGNRTEARSMVDSRWSTSLWTMVRGLSTCFVLVLTLSLSAAAYDDDSSNIYDAASKARQAHELASSDMIYQQEEWKALYYQNIQIIDLLKDIRDSLQVIKAKGGMKNTEDTSQ